MKYLKYTAAVLVTLTLIAGIGTVFGFPNEGSTKAVLWTGLWFIYIYVLVSECLDWFITGKRWF